MVRYFHALSAKILRKHSELVGLKSNFVIIDSDDQLKLIKKICESENIDIKEKTPNIFLQLLIDIKIKEFLQTLSKLINIKKIKK